MSKRKGTFKYRLAGLVLAAAMVFTSISMTDLGSVTANAAGDGVYRVSGGTRFQTSLSVAEQLRAEMGVEKFDAVILSTGMEFADALSGSYLSYVKNAPILLIGENTPVYNEVRSYVKKYLKEGGTVYILGGENAIPKYMENFAGYDGEEPFEVVRLSGKNRYETNLAILEAAGVNAEMEAGEILVCTGTNYADSLSAAAAKKPILLVGKSLNAAQKDFLDVLPEGMEYTVVGGTNAVSDGLKDSLDDYGTTDRISGKNRYVTSVAIAEAYVENPESVVVAYGLNFPDGLCGGLLAAVTNSAIVLSPASVSTVVTDYVTANNIADGYVLGGTGVFADEVIAGIFGIETSEIQETYWGTPK